MNQAAPRESNVTVPQSAALAAILTVGVWLRFYHLDTPSLWPDEMLVALMATFPIPYIAQWAKALEVHPPTYHYFIKLVEYCGQSDFILRLPSAVAGTASIWLVWRAGQLFLTAQAGLFAAALLAANPLHVWLSRQVRPYGLMVFFFLLAFICLGRYLRTGERGQLHRAMLANLPLLLTHYIAILMVGAQGVVLLVVALARRKWPPLRDTMLFGCVCVLSFLPVLPFFLAMVGKRADMTAKAPWSVVFNNTLDYAAGLFNLFSHPALTWGTGAAWILGCVGLIGTSRSGRAWLAYCLSFMVLPFSVILYQRYNTFYFSSHVSFMLPAVVLPAGYGLAMLVRRERLMPAAAVLVAVLMGASLFSHDYDKLYKEDSTIISWWNFGSFKRMAKDFPVHVAPTDQVIFSDMSLSYSLNWYLRQFSSLNPVENPRMLPGVTPVRMHFLSTDQRFGDLLPSDAGVSATGSFNRWRLDALHVTTVEVGRTPLHAVGSLPAELVVTGRPTDFFSKVHAMEGLALKPDWDGALYPSRYDTPGWAEFVLENHVLGVPQNITLGAFITNLGNGNEVFLEYSVDDGPVQRQLWSSEPLQSGFFTVTLSPDSGYSRLKWRIVMTCRANTPYGYGGSLPIVQLKSVHAWVCEREDDGFCHQKRFEALVRMVQDSFRDIRLDPVIPLAHQSAEFPPQGLKATEELPGWIVLTPSDPNTPATVRLKVTLGEEGAIFYPRVEGLDSTVVARLTSPGQDPKELLKLQGLPGRWTPIGARYTLPMTQGQECEVAVTLSGPWAQLWTRDGSVVFSSR